MVDWLEDQRGLTLSTGQIHNVKSILNGLVVWIILAQVYSKDKGAIQLYIKGPRRPSRSTRRFYKSTSSWPAAEICRASSVSYTEKSGLYSYYHLLLGARHPRSLVETQVIKEFYRKKQNFQMI